MFGFGLQKLIVLALVIGAVWYGFKYFSRLDALRRRVDKSVRADGGKVTGGSAKPDAAQDMERCETCGDFVAVGAATSCGREACPYTG